MLLSKKCGVNFDAMTNRGAGRHVVAPRLRTRAAHPSAAANAAGRRYGGGRHRREMGVKGGVIILEEYES